jgi:peptide chain release factor subunit 1
MISKKQIDELLSRPRPHHPLLSVYLNTDRADGNNLNRKFEAALKSILNSLERGLSSDEMKIFAANANQISDFVNNYTSNARTLVFFSNASEGFFRSYELQVALKNKASWSFTPYVKPLIEALDQNERYAVALVDKSKARLFQVFLGELEEEQDLVAPAEVRHIKLTGTDHPESQNTIQRKSDRHALWHLKHVSEVLDDLYRKRNFRRLILAGTEEVTREFEGLLPKALQSLIVARLSLSIHAATKDILDIALKVEKEIERKDEAREVEDLITMALKRGQAVLGVESVLDALSKRQIEKLVYVNSKSKQGAECAECKTLFTEIPNACPYCQGKIEKVDDLLEIIVEQVLMSGGKIEEIIPGTLQEQDGKHEVYESFSKWQNIGAFLRFPSTEGRVYQQKAM